MNERLETAMRERGVSPADVAARCGVDPKTADRWITPGRIPHRRHRWTIAQLLDVNEDALWPPKVSGSRPHMFVSDLVAVHPDRASVPRDVWIQHLTNATNNIDVLVFSGTFFAQSNPRVAKMLAERASSGAQVRLCFGNPDGHAVKIRDREEGLHNTLPSKIKASLTYYRALAAAPGCEVRLHDTTLYASLFRYDDHLIVNPHIFGQPASANPVLHLRRRDDSGWFERYADSFTAVWNTSVPWAPRQEAASHNGQN